MSEIDWAALERQARRAEHRRAPATEIGVRFDLPKWPAGRVEEWRHWPGQDYGGLAVVRHEAGSPRKDAAGLWQAIHVPTGFCQGEHRREIAVRALALALLATPVDWPALDETGFRGHPEAWREAVRAVLTAWRERYWPERAAVAGRGGAGGEG